jgi:hypothetical protein
MLTKIIIGGFIILCYPALSFSENFAVLAGGDSVGINIPYMSGGIGSDERDALSQKSRDFNLKVVCATKGGAYLPDIALKIKEENGTTVLAVQSEGPWFFAKLSPGNYTVTATLEETTLSQKVQITQGGQSIVYFFWPERGTEVSTSTH